MASKKNIRLIEDVVDEELLQSAGPRKRRREVCEAKQSIDCDLDVPSAAFESDACATVVGVFLKQVKKEGTVELEPRVSNTSVGRYSMEQPVAVSKNSREKTARVMVPTSSLDFVAQHGIRGDVNAATLSPRQVLLSDQECISALGLKPGHLRENICLQWNYSAVQNHCTNTTSVPHPLSARGNGRKAGGQKEGREGTRHLFSGMRVLIGDEVQLRISFDCEPCGHVIAPLKGVVSRVPTIKDLAPPRRGVLAVVLKGGSVRPGDTVRIIEHRRVGTKVGPSSCLQFETIPYAVNMRVRWLLSKVPPGKVVTYRSILQLIGAPIGYSRALPSILKKILKDEVGHFQNGSLAAFMSPSSPSARAARSFLPVHRVIDSSGKLLPCLRGIDVPAAVLKRIMVSAAQSEAKPAPQSAAHGAMGKGVGVMANFWKQITGGASSAAKKKGADFQIAMLDFEGVKVEREYVNLKQWCWNPAFDELYLKEAAFR